MGPDTWQVLVTTTLKIDAGRCRNCGDCSRFCPRGVIQSSKENGTPPEQRGSCDPGCRICARVCPHGALSFTDEEAFINYLNLRLEKVRKALQEIETHPKYQLQWPDGRVKSTVSQHR